MKEIVYETVHGDKIAPRHYNGRNGAQVIDITSECDFCTGNVIKYVFRAGKKGGESRIDDLRKAKWYLDRLIEEENER